MSTDLHHALAQRQRARYPLRLSDEQSLAHTQMLLGIAHFHTENPTLSASLLLDTWEGNPLAQALQERLPMLAELCVPVPDGYFIGQENHAPQLIPLPAQALDTMGTWTAHTPAAQYQDTPLVWTLLCWLSDCLSQALLDATARLVPQHFCAVLWSAGDNAQATPAQAAHCAQLGLQYAPRYVPQYTPQHTPQQTTDNAPKPPTAAHLFRYQDPRVLQNIWSAFNAQRRSLWLGPIVQWWAVNACIGPWSPQDLHPNPSLSLPELSWWQAHAPEPAVVKAERSATPLAEQPRNGHLLSPALWAQAHQARTANHCWQHWARAQVPAPAQPGPLMLRAILNQAQRLPMDDAHTVAFAMASWHDGQRRNWEAPPWDAVLRGALADLHTTPEANLSELLQRHTPAALLASSIAT